MSLNGNSVGTGSRQEDRPTSGDGDRRTVSENRYISLTALSLVRPVRPQEGEKRSLCHQSVVGDSCKPGLQPGSDRSWACGPGLLTQSMRLPAGTTQSSSVAAQGGNCCHQASQGWRQAQTNFDHRSWGSDCCLDRWHSIPAVASTQSERSHDVRRAG